MDRGPVNEVVNGPVSVIVERGGHPESIHLVDVSVAQVKNARVDVTSKFGSTSDLIFPRSAVKFLQVLPLVETGAHSALNLNSEHLAVACASHNGEPVHTELVHSWLTAMKQEVSALECGSHQPHHIPTANNLILRAEKPSNLHNNCSGKHTGVVATCVQCGEGVAGYTDRNHPAQVRIQKVFEDFTETDLKSDSLWGVDGCSMPAVRVTLDQLACAMANFANPARLSKPHQESVRLIQKCLIEHPYLIAGHDRLCTEINQMTKGECLVKVGAEGVFIALRPSTGEAVALKVRDGTGRAANVALVELLLKWKWVDQAHGAILRKSAREDLYSWRGRNVGHVTLNMN